jgi:hypothetical protein
MVRAEYANCGLNPHQYDYRVQNAVNGIDYLQSKLNEEFKGRAEK